MAVNVAELMVKIGGDISDLEGAISKAQRTLEDTGKRMRRVGAKMTAGITAPLAALGGTALSTAADFESLQQSMNILNGSVEEGARNFERLKRFSATTPFQLQDLAEAQNMLQGFSLSADQAFESMSMIGDIAAVTGGDIQGIGIAFGQAAAEGRLMTRDIRQLINQGVPAIQLLADTMDVATDEVLDLASEGQISFDILVQAFQDATSEGGMFADGMAKQANTLAGIWSTLKDNVNIALAELGDSIVDTFDLKTLAKDLTANLQIIVQRFQEMSKESKRQILQVAGLFAAGGPLLIVLGQAAIAISAFVKFVRTRFALITLAIAGTIGVVKQWRQVWNNVFGDATQDIDNIVTATKKGMQEAMGAIIGFTEEALGMNGALGEFKELLSGLTGAEGLKSLTDDTNDATDAFKDFNSETGKGGGERSVSNTSVGTAGMGGISGMTARISDNLETMKVKATEFSTVAQAAGIQVAGRFRWMGNVMTDIANRFTDSFGQGMANVVLQGEKLVDTLGNIGRLLASSVIQKGLSVLLTGGIAGAGGFLGIGGGLLGAIGIPGLASGGLAFGPTMAVVGDNRNARSDPEVISPLSKLQGMMDSGGSRELHARIKGSDIYLSSERGQNKFR